MLLHGQRSFVKNAHLVSEPKFTINHPEFIVIIVAIIIVIIIIRITAMVVLYVIVIISSIKRL